jgi:hypothetical protein
VASTGARNIPPGFWFGEGLGLGASTGARNIPPGFWFGEGVRVVNGTSGPGVHPKLLQFVHGGGGSAGAGAGAAAGAAVSTTAPTTAAPLANRAHMRSRDDRTTCGDPTALWVSSLLVTNHLRRRDTTANRGPGRAVPGRWGP